MITEEDEFNSSSKLSQYQGFILIYSIASRESFSQIPVFHENLSSTLATTKFPLVLVASQSDKDRVVSNKEGRECAQNYQCPFVEVSALTGEHVENVFIEIIEEIETKQKQKQLTLNQKS